MLSLSRWDRNVAAMCLSITVSGSRPSHHSDATYEGTTRPRISVPPPSFTPLAIVVSHEDTPSQAVLRVDHQSTGALSTSPSSNLHSGREGVRPRMPAQTRAATGPRYPALVRRHIPCRPAGNQGEPTRSAGSRTRRSCMCVVCGPRGPRGVVDQKCHSCEAARVARSGGPVISQPPGPDGLSPASPGFPLPHCGFSCGGTWRGAGIGSCLGPTIFLRHAMPPLSLLFPRCGISWLDGEALRHDPAPPRLIGLNIPGRHGLIFIFWSRPICHVASKRAGTLCRRRMDLLRLAT